MRKSILPEINVWARMAGAVLYIILVVLHVLCGKRYEKPQRTYWWSQIAYEGKLDVEEMVFVLGDADSKISYLGKIFPNIPILGGWKRYVVLSVGTSSIDWCVGWRSSGVTELILTRQKGEVRMLIGPGDVEFFAINLHTGAQINLKKIADGTFGKNVYHQRTPMS